MKNDKVVTTVLKLINKSIQQTYNLQIRHGLFTDHWIRKTKDNKYVGTRQTMVKLLRKFDPPTGASKKILHKNFVKWKLDYV